MNIFAKGARLVRRLKPSAILLSTLLGSTMVCADGGSVSDDDDLAPYDLDPIVEAIMEYNNIPGLAIALVANPEDPIIWAKGYGVRNIETGSPMTANSAFWMGSVSKAVTGTAIMRAKQQGLVDLDQPIAPLLKERGEFTVGRRQLKSLTLRHLASHTGSIYDLQDSYTCAYSYEIAAGKTDYLANLLNYDHKCPASGPNQLDTYLQAYLDRGGIYYKRGKNFINKKPGNIHNYSNIGAALAGHMLGLITHQELADYAQQQIFTPLAMTDTSWRLGDFSPEQLVTGHTLAEGQVLALPQYHLATWPDGGLRSSAADMSRLLATVMNQGRFGAQGHRLLSPANNQELLALTDQESDPRPQYGVFWHHSVMNDAEGKTRRVIGHDGSDPGIATFAFFSPELKAGYVLLVNQDEFEYEHLKVLQSILLSSAAALAKSADE